MSNLHALVDEGLSDRIIQIVSEKCRGQLSSCIDVCRVVDSYDFNRLWRQEYRLKTFADAVLSPSLTCFDATVVSYRLLTLLENLEPGILAIHRRSEDGEECGHVVSIFRDVASGLWGAISKSNFAHLTHCDAIFESPTAIAIHYARGYKDISIEPLYFGWIDGDTAPSGCALDAQEEVESLYERLLESYAYAFA